MQKIKNMFKSLLSNDTTIYKVLKKMYRAASTIKYKIIHSKESYEHKKIYKKRVNEAVKIIEKYRDKDYIVLYNPTWLGVAASTTGLFKNYVPLEQVLGKNNVKKITEAIVNSNIKSVILSQIVDGWTNIIEEIKNEKNEINIKVIWHGNCYEFFSDYTWNLNKEVMNLYNKKKIDCLGFVRSTMYEFYKKMGFKVFYLQNNVHKHCEKVVKNNKENVTIGIYNADSRELKNIYTALSAIKLVPNAVADVVPINEGAKKFANILNLKITSVDEYIQNDDLMKRIKMNDINVYPTFTENAPMFPLESFEMGVPCLLGNNNDFFIGTELGKYIILDKEDDPEYISKKIINVLENKELVMKLYKDWKYTFDKKCEKYVQDFISI